MKKIFIMAFAALFSIACSDDVVKCDDVETVIYIQKNGLQEIVLPAGNPVYELWIQKGGYNTIPCEVSLTVEAEDVAVFNADNKSSYKVLPGNCYEFDRESVCFSGDLRKSCVAISFDPDCLPSDDNFLLPVRVGCKAGSGSVNEELSVAYLHIRIEER